MAVRTTPPKPRVSLDRSIERMRKQLTEFAPFLGKGKPTRSLEEFDLETERLIEGGCDSGERQGRLVGRELVPMPVQPERFGCRACEFRFIVGRLVEAD